MALLPQMRMVRFPNWVSYALMRDCVVPSLLTNGSSGTATSRQFMPLRTALQVAPREPGGPISAAHAWPFRSVYGTPTAAAAAIAWAYDVRKSYA